MKSTERRKELLIWLEEEGTLSLSEMVERFGVSKMTIHRDLDLLEQRQVLKRIHGGAARIEKLVRDRDGRYESRLEQGSCLVCFRPPTQQLLYTLTLKNGEQKVACCPHCGISAHLMLGDRIAMALTADYLTGKLHSAQHSYFVFGSVAVPCCRPSILTFEDKEMADRFQKGFGGQVGSLSDAMTFLERDMSLDKTDGCPHCAAAKSQQDG
ncbi:DeoR-like helix-turn-helix domain-containing protein [Malonomonas rubra DSM 5091]|uniref:DeoR-like helix-turn-helix domain-containing protein n=1 Tax=Malonomonas rubra DSM 5091 TaxID=1122189 RepID=A0A1M6M4Y1_MALRU|nr:DeoR family transcriptional regulator [Malonomonas rubra]SHJ78521.1 DeoR-like helix-turn-helix domain-containing protein [Malonomonas rubra DSM 5091]